MEKILIVEDDRATQQLMVSALAFKGFKAICANNGLEALALLEQNMFSLVLLDIDMPEMNGNEFARTLRKYHEDSETRIIIVSAVKPSGFEKWLELGISQYVTKPIDLKLLFEEIIRVLATRHCKQKAIQCKPIHIYCP